MKDNVVNMQDITSALREKHAAFIGKYGVAASRKIADRALQRDQVYARLALIARAFEKAGVTSRHEEVEVRSVKDSYLRSVALVTVAGTPIYLLNGGDHVVLTDGAVSEDPLNRTLVLLSGAKHTSIVKSYEGVLKDDFDWRQLALDALDAVHKIAYYSTEVMHRYFESMGGEDA
jgi:glycine/D-amino acid oxidase-like deaminating enzyme